MSGICRYLIISRNIFLHYRRQDFVITSSFISYLSSKQIRNNSNVYVLNVYKYIHYMKIYILYNIVFIIAIFQVCQ